MEKRVLFFVAICCMMLACGAEAEKPYYYGNTLGCEGLSADFIEKGTGLSPLRLMGNTIMLTGKRADVNPDNLLISQVDIQGRKLFARGGELLLLGDNGAPLAVTEKSLKNNGKNQIKGALRGQAGSIDVKVDLTVEFDGTFIYALNLTPAENGSELKRLAMVFTMNLPDDKLISAQVEGPNKPQSGLEAERRRLRLNVKDKAPVRPGFCPFFWVGDTRGGFSIANEHAHDWNTAPGNEVVFNPADSSLTVNVIEQPIKLTKAVTYRFYMNVTPLRRMPKDWRGWQMGTRYDKYTNTSNNLLVYWQFWRANKTEIHNNHWRYKPELLKEIADLDKRAGRKILHYIHPQLTSHTVVTQYNGKTLVLEDPWLRELCDKYRYLPQPSWMGKTPDFPPDALHFTDSAERDKAQNGELLNGKVSSVSVAPVPGFADNFVSAVDEMIQLGADGIYCDGAGPRENYRPNDDMGGRNDFRGVLRPTYPIESYRTIFKRIRALVRNNNPDALMLAHNSGVAYAPIISFFDMRMTGENEFYWYKEEDVRDMSPDGEFYYAYIWGDIDNLKGDYWRAWGLPTVFLPELKGKDHKPFAKRTQGTRTMLAYTIQFDYVYWPLWSDEQVIRRFDAIRQKFGMKEDSTGTVAFVPYWENALFKSSDAAVKLGYYERLQQIDPDFARPEERRYLLLASNIQFSEAKATVTLPKAPFPLKAFDRQRNRELPVVNNAIELKIAPFDFDVIEIIGK